MAGTIVMAGMGRGGSGSIVGYGLTISFTEIVLPPTDSQYAFTVCVSYINETAFI